MSINLDELELGIVHLQNLTEVTEIEVLTDSNGKVWINVDGMCVLRANKFSVIAVRTPTKDFTTLYKPLT